MCDIINRSKGGRHRVRVPCRARVVGHFLQYLTPLGSREGAVVRALASHRCLWSGFDSRTWRHIWVEFVAGSRPCSEGFSAGSPVFLSQQKLTLQIPIEPETGDEETLCGCATAKSNLLFYHWFYLFYLRMLLKMAKAKGTGTGRKANELRGR